MTAFVLVSGPFTGGQVWQQVADRLRAAGAEVHPVTLTGLGDGRHPDGPSVDLETHVADLVRLIDGLDAPEVVLVGHDYGIHPVLGAADRRPRRVARIVHLDAGMPQDGDAAVALVADPTVRERLLRAADPLLPAPAPDEWQRWGSTDGLGEDDLALLSRLSAPQPVASFTQPLRLTGAARTVPTTGIFCTAGGMTIATVEFLISSGPVQFRALADPRVTFFELATGHWPMLSAPGDLAAVLLRAAAGEGHTVAAPTLPEAEQHFSRRRFVLDVPEQRRERTGPVDLYLPELRVGDGPRPAVVFVHGGPVPLPGGEQPAPRDWPLNIGYASYAASLGVVGVTFDHRLHALADFAQAAGDVAAAVERVRADPRVDPDRIALWFFSGGGPLSADWLAAPPSWLRCVAVTYPILAPLPGWTVLEPRFRPVAALSTAGELPVVLTRAGLEHPEPAATVQEFLAAAEEHRVKVEVIDVPHGHHGFELLDLTDESAAAVAQAVRAVLAHLEPRAVSPGTAE